MRENVAETADTVDIAPVGIGYGILDAYFFFFFFFFFGTLFSKNILSDFSKTRHAHVQFYLRRVQSFCSVDVRCEVIPELLKAFLKRGCCDDTF